MTPFKALYGQDPPIFFQRDTFPSKVEEAKKLTEEKD